VANTGTDHAVEEAFGILAERKADAFFACGSPFHNSRREYFALLAARQAIPGMYSNRDHVTAGGLISYGASIPDAYRQVGAYVGRILKGERTADLPIVQPTKFELVINLKAAKVLRLAVPDRVLALADEVIE